jgi:multidrug transporter EmrE-like cation transporter
LEATTADPIQMGSTPLSRYQPVLLVFGCTILGAAAQILMKTGANQLTHPGLLAMATSLPLMAGYSLYGLSTVLLVLALRDGELSLLYPVIALTYVWVTFLSFMIFHDNINVWKLCGISLIVGGVGVLGRSGGR